MTLRLGPRACWDKHGNTLPILTRPGWLTARTCWAEGPEEEAESWRRVHSGQGANQRCPLLSPSPPRGPAVRTAQLSQASGPAPSLQNKGLGLGGVGVVPPDPAQSTPRLSPFLHAQPSSAGKASWEAALSCLLSSFR